MNRVVVGLFLLWMLGCAGWDPEARARDQAREWLDCEEVALESVGESAYRASGCGRTLGVACTTSTNEPYCTRVRIASAGGEESGARAGAESGTGIGAGVEAESLVRALLDARREDVLACASRERVVVRASWSASGDVGWTLEGELAGSPEEGCARAALGPLHVDVTAAGTLLHLVRR